jgi:hypothetical protein
MQGSRDENVDMIESTNADDGLDGTSLIPMDDGTAASAGSRITLDDKVAQFVKTVMSKAHPMGSDEGSVHRLVQSVQSLFNMPTFTDCDVNIEVYIVDDKS